MNKLLTYYCQSLEFPDVSGAEHLELIEIREELASIESELTEAEKRQLSIADSQLIKKAARFYAELSRFINLKQKREAEPISAEHWWWYLDVLAHLPQSLYTEEISASS